MNQIEMQKLHTGIKTAFIDGNVVSDLFWRPQFLSNNYQEGRKVLSSVEEELLHCDQFQISVAFITLSGVEPLLQTLKELERKGIRGRILTTDYLNFSQPKALDKLNSLRNIELRIYRTGRGLRKAKDKEFVVVLDFIGNYTNNYMIPIALSGDRSYNKDNMRKYVAEGTRIIPGSSSIHFDEIARSQIYESIDNAKTNTIKLLKDSYRDLKYKLGHIPTINDFAAHGGIDAIKYFEKCGSYHNFLKQYEPDYPVVLNDSEEQVIEYISTKLATGKRIYELEMLNLLTRRNDRLWFYFSKIMRSQYGIDLSREDRQSLLLNLTNQFGKDASDIR